MLLAIKTFLQVPLPLPLLVHVLVVDLCFMGYNTFILLDQTAVSYLKQVLYRTVDYLRLDVTKITIEQLLTDVKHLVKVKDVTPVPHILTNVEIPDKTIQIDGAKIKQLFVNRIAYIHQHNLDNKPIIITVSKTMLGHYWSDGRLYAKTQCC